MRWTAHCDVLAEGVPLGVQLQVDFKCCIKHCDAQSVRPPTSLEEPPLGGTPPLRLSGLATPGACSPFPPRRMPALAHSRALLSTAALSLALARMRGETSVLHACSFSSDLDVVTLTYL